MCGDGVRTQLRGSAPLRVDLCSPLWNHHHSEHSSKQQHDGDNFHPNDTMLAKTQHGILHKRLLDADYE